MMNSDEPVQKMKSSNDESSNLTSLSGDEILKLAGWSDQGDGRDIPSTLSSRRKRMRLTIAGILMLISMFVDPLFLYVPIIKENIMCLTLDQKLKKTAITLRIFTDLPYLSGLIKLLPECASRTHGSSPKKLAICFILCILPIPQIIILVFLPTTRDSRSLNRMKVLNSLIVLQYVARACPIYGLCKQVNKGTREYSNNILIRKKIWITGALNFILYILASNVLGAFWYFFSIQRKIDCWISTCRSENGCDVNTLQCDNTIFRNITLLNDLCPTNPPNPMVFDFGIFINALQSGIVGTTDFSQKFLICLSWGLRNLSSFASNLDTSTYAWETLFVIFISISGLLLFIYLLGHLQTFMQATTRNYRILQRRKVIIPQINFMLSEYGLPGHHADAIWTLVSEALNDHEDLPVENIISLLPLELMKHMKQHLFLATLKKVPRLENIDRQVLNAIVEDLGLVSCADGSYIIREGEPLDRIFFITQGIALAYKTSSTGGESGLSNTTHLAKGDVYGKELMGWAATSTPFSGLPISDKTVKSHEKVEVFAIRAATLQHIVSKFSTHFNTELPHLTDTTLVETHVEIH